MRDFSKVTNPVKSSLPHVSVVTPVYNGEPYLVECIESVLNQTYENWDYTIVNNCSTDRSLEIAQRYAEADDRIRVVNNETFLGQVDNLNKAMSLMRDDAAYCKLVLADDWIFPRCLEEMVALAEQHPRAGIVSSYRLDDRHVNCGGLPFPSRCVDGREICRRSLMEGLFVFGSPNTLLYRKDVVKSRQPFYRDHRLHEDTLSCYEILETWDFGFVPQVLSFTRRQEVSVNATHRNLDPHFRLSQLLVTARFGPRFLTPEENGVCFEHRRREYYKFLARNIRRRRDGGFWDHHRKSLAEVGLLLEWRRVAYYNLRWLTSELLRPLRLLAVAVGGALPGDRAHS